MRVAGADIAVTEWGSGPPVLMLHGNPDSGESGKRSPALLAATAPVWRRIFRASAVPRCRRDLSRRSTAWRCLFAQILESAGVKPPINLIAHDFGGPFAFAWAVKHPDSVCHMVATNTLFFSDYKWHFWAQVWLTPVLGQLSMAIINPTMFSRELGADPAARSTMSISRT